jgi:shikimate kinase
MRFQSIERNRIIALTGPKHCGKTRTALALSRLLHIALGDLDALIERRTGKAPRTLYREGPAVFREAEAAALASLLPPSSALALACGGGIIDNEEAMGLLVRREDTTLVYLDVPVETAWERIQAAARESGELPPFLSGDDPQEAHRALHCLRARAYRAVARIVISADGKTPERIAGEIAQGMGAA